MHTIIYMAAVLISLHIEQHLYDPVSHSASGNMLNYTNVYGECSAVEVATVPRNLPLARQLKRMAFLFVRRHLLWDGMSDPLTRTTRRSFQLGLLRDMLYFVASVRFLLVR